MVSNLKIGETYDLEFSLAMIDSWDGSSSQYGSDIMNMNVTSGSSTLASFSNAYSNVNSLNSTGYVDQVIVDSVQLGFNNGSQTWWYDDALIIKVENLVAVTNTITFELFATSGGSGSGFQGGNDESFAIDNFSLSRQIPEPGIPLFLVLTTLFSLVFVRKRTQ